MARRDACTSLFAPHALRDYALLADGERGALVGPRGDVVWMCAPRWESDAVFCSLIGGRGSYAITPVGRFVWGGFYEDGSLIWRSRWVTEQATVECREALAVPTEPGRAVLLRRIIATSGPARVRVLLDPRAGFGHYALCALSLQDGVWSGRTGPLHMRWSGGSQARPGTTGPDRHMMTMEVSLAGGEHHDLVLELSDQPLPEDLVDPDRAWEATARSWSAAVPQLSDTVARSDARHAYAVLHGLTSIGGGMVAAATMSLPERAGQGRNYDYRYAWIRDQCFTGQAVAAAGPYPLLDDSVRFVADRLLADGPQLKPAYTVIGGVVPEERPLGLPGYPGGHDILGNHVSTQFQLDSFGESLLLFAAAARADHLDAEGWRAAAIAVATIAQRFAEPEAGIWELDRHAWTESRLICVAGLRAISAAGAPANVAADWLALSDKIMAETAASSTHPSGRWQRAPDDERLDAALLLPPIRGAPPADDPRTLATLRAIEEELGQDNYLYRFRHQPGPLADAEGAFLLCGFVMALALHQQGREVEATRWFERNRAACGPPGLYTEEYDVGQRQLRGNLPQAFVHALMLEGAVRLARPWQAST